MELLHGMFVCFRTEFMRLPKCDPDRPAARPTVTNRISLVQTFDAYGNDGNAETDRHHSDARTKCVQASVRCALSFGKYQWTISAPDQVPRIIECTTHTGKVLRQRIRVK